MEGDMADHIKAILEDIGGIWNIVHMEETHDRYGSWKFRLHVSNGKAMSCVLSMQEGQMILVANCEQFPKNIESAAKQLEVAGLCCKGKFVAFSEKYSICWLGVLPKCPSDPKRLKASLMVLLALCAEEIQESKPILNRIVKDKNFLMGATRFLPESTPRYV